MILGVTSVTTLDNDSPDAYMVSGLFVYLGENL